MFALREPYSAPILKLYPRRLFVARVGGADLGDFYKDDNGHLWRYETKSGFPYGEIRAVTDAYGGAQTEWVDRAMLPSHDHDEINSSIDLKAAILGASEAAAKAAEEAGGGGGTSPTFKSKTPGSSLPSSISKSETPIASASAPTLGTNTFFLFLGMLGAGLIAWKLIG